MNGTPPDRETTGTYIDIVTPQPGVTVVLANYNPCTGCGTMPVKVRRKTTDVAKVLAVEITVGDIIPVFPAKIDPVIPFIRRPPLVGNQIELPLNGNDFELPNFPVCGVPPHPNITNKALYCAAYDISGNKMEEGSVLFRAKGPAPIEPKG